MRDAGENCASPSRRLFGGLYFEIHGSGTSTMQEGVGGLKVMGGIFAFASPPIDHLPHALFRSAIITPEDVVSDIGVEST